MIAAVAENRAIGRNNSLPWRLPDDLRYFKKMTLGKPVIMGRKTYEELGKPLPGRLNIILSKAEQTSLPEGVLHFVSLENALAYLENQPDLSENQEIFVIGGGQVFELALPLADKLYITKVHAQIPDADAFFPVIDHTHWKLIAEENHKKDEKNEYDFAFQQYSRAEF